MPVSVVVGGQYGSEGKGKVSHWFARKLGASTAVRVGGPNSGHTVFTDQGARLVFRQLPTPAILPDVTCVLAAGSYITPALLLDEMKAAHLSSDRLFVDPLAVVITDGNVLVESELGLRDRIGSTLTGTGAAVAARVTRNGSVRFARDEPQLQGYLRPAAPYLRARLDAGERVIVEGTQGFGLSVLHSPHYPFTTSRDTTAAGFISESGLSPLDVDDVILVLRTFPIRVAGHSGPLCDEISWERVTAESGSHHAITELTSVTKSLRRVARFDPDIVRQAIACNAPTRIVLNHLDYLDSSNGSATMSAKAGEFLRRAERDIGRQITHLGFGPQELEQSTVTQGGQRR